jgi:hypothetical protein
MKMRFLLALAGLASGSTLARVFVVIALLACNSNAASLQPSETRQKWEDLEVITLDSKGNPAKAVYYSHEQLLTLPTVTVKTERDPNTNRPATYTGVYIGDLFEAFGADASFDVIGTHSLDNYKQYYDRDYIAKRTGQQRTDFAVFDRRMGGDDGSAGFWESFSGAHGYAGMITHQEHKKSADFIRRRIFP